jgi:CHASE3 domain sensor protein
MQKPTIRYVVAGVLIAAAAIGGFFVFDARRRAADVETQAREVHSRIEQMITASGDLAAAQQAYVVQGQPQQPWFEKSTTLLQQFKELQSGIRPLLKSRDDLAAVDTVDEQFKTMGLIDGRSRQYLEQGESLLASDLIFGEGRDSIAAVVKELRTIDASEQQGAAAMRSDLERQQWGALAGIAVIWLAGLVLLTPPAQAPPAERSFGNLNLGLSDRTPSDSASQPASPPAAALPQPDLALVADVCGALARTTDAGSLRDALARAAAVLDARGIVVWIGAGEELFPAVAHGYDERIVARFRPIPRNAANATAAAWRSAQMRTVPADAASNGAVAVPLSGINGCVGVLAAELRDGREQNVATQAVAAVIAAQLAAIIPAWPAPSTTQPIAASHS